MKTYVARVAAYVSGICSGLLGFVIFSLADFSSAMSMPETVPRTVPAVLLVLTFYALVAVAFAFWEQKAARIFSVVSPLVLFVPLALFLVFTWLIPGNKAIWFDVIVLTVVGVVSPLDALGHPINGSSAAVAT
jgi:hypothetical protein